MRSRQLTTVVCSGCGSARLTRLDRADRGYALAPRIDAWQAPGANFDPDMVSARCRRNPRAAERF